VALTGLRAILFSFFLGGRMKKVVFGLMFLCLAAAAFADDGTVSSISGMIKSDLFKNQSNIQSLSQSLTSTEKMALYTEYKKDPWVPFLVNFLVGAGVGSFIEGDTTGGVIALTGDLVGLGSVLIGVSAYASEVYWDPYTTKGVGLTTFGYIVLIGSRIFEIVRPFTYTARYNSTLKQSLNYIEGLSFVPTFENGVAGISLSYSVRLN
jgi:roadblock/LC7 domain-containing protein